MKKSEKKMKRLFDMFFTSILLLLSLFLLMPVAIIIKLADGGPVISKHIRVGKNSQLFVMYKLRTRKREALTAVNLGKIPLEWISSVPETFQYDKDIQTMNNVTPFGKILRKTRLDEVPQFWNVLIGNMSLVGPRPELRDIADHYNSEQMKRLTVQPGITGLAQVSGGNDLTYGDKFYLDNKYIDNYSLLLDIKILFLTALVPWKKIPQSKRTKQESMIR